MVARLVQQVPQGPDCVVAGRVVGVESRGGPGVGVWLLASVFGDGLRSGAWGVLGVGAELNNCRGDLYHKRSK